MSRITTPKSTPAVFSHDHSNNNNNNSNSIMTPTTRSRLRSVHEQGSQPFEEIPTEALLPIIGDHYNTATTTNSHDNNNYQDEYSFNNGNNNNNNNSVIEAVFKRVCQTLLTCANASHKELDWGAQYEALIEMRRLTVHHNNIIKNGISHRYNNNNNGTNNNNNYNSGYFNNNNNNNNNTNTNNTSNNVYNYHVLKNILTAVTSLRSHVSKTALLLINEMFVFMGKVLEHELESIVPVLVKRSR